MATAAIQAEAEALEKRSQAENDRWEKIRGRPATRAAVCAGLGRRIGSSRSGFVHLRTLASFLRGKLLRGAVEFGRDGEWALAASPPLPEVIEGIHHKSSRRPLKHG